jgi:hypothetical protein
LDLALRSFNLKKIFFKFGTKRFPFKKNSRLRLEGCSKTKEPANSVGLPVVLSQNS